ncbi:hypothetical protein D4764_05G0011080 [Takifugu flavidus]|uniref:Uncharacterized protein n=1 Tax=Takifugu flavidus TaxID=433684 RepID=A0A5C6N2L7_9TELE|nr:hypothetical protein D4764_05G0011080 [Takifugu flavidus]
MLQSRVNHDSPTTSTALRNSGWISSTPGALPPRSFLTTSITSAPEIRELVPRSPGPASSLEGMLVVLRRRRMVVLNLFEAVRKSFSMVSPNSSHAQVFASVTTVADLRLACRYLSAATGVPQATGSDIAAMTGTNHPAATAPVSCLNNGGTEHGPLGLNVLRLPRDMVKTLPEVSVRHPSPPSEPTHHQVVIS